MDSISISFEDRKKLYNDIPVSYCTECLSLRIRVMNDGMEYCDNCGGAHIDTAHINEWKKIYAEKYNMDFIEEKNDKD